MFGARAYAGNFDDEEMKEAIRYAHIHGVKVYVTMNTLLHEQEMDAAFSYVRFLYAHDVDALIIQDIGLADRCIASFRIWSFTHPRRCISITAPG